MRRGGEFSLSILLANPILSPSNNITAIATFTMVLPTGTIKDLRQLYSFKAESRILYTCNVIQLQLLLKIPANACVGR